MSTTQYWFDGTDLVYEKDNTGDSREYYYGPDGLLSMYDSSGSARRYHFFDGMGSTSELTNENGTELGTYTYDAWGNQLSSPNVTNPFRFIGKYGYYYGSADGMYLLQQRYYRQSTGRFWTRDPAQAGGNWWVYVGNRPLVRVDPTGLIGLDPLCGQGKKGEQIKKDFLGWLNKLCDAMNHFSNDQWTQIAACAQAQTGDSFPHDVTSFSLCMKANCGKGIKVECPMPGTPDYKSCEVEGTCSFSKCDNKRPNALQTANVVICRGFMYNCVDGGYTYNVDCSPWRNGPKPPGGVGREGIGMVAHEMAHSCGFCSGEPKYEKWADALASCIVTAMPK